MLVTVVGVDVFSGDTVIEMTQKVNVYRSFRSGKQCFGSRVAVNLSGMRQNRPFARGTQKDVVTEPTDKRRHGNGKSVISGCRKHPSAILARISEKHLPARDGKCRDVRR